VGVVAVEVQGSVVGVAPTVTAGETITSGETRELVAAEKHGKQEYEACEGAAVCEEGKKTFHLEADFGTGFKSAILVGIENVKFNVSVTPTF
jgi:hypothetical protein